MVFRKILKRMISVGLTTVIVGTLMMGCGSKANVGGANSDPSKLDPVTFKMYLIGDKPKDFDEVYGKVNEIMKEKINATANKGELIPIFFPIIVVNDTTTPECELGIPPACINFLKLNFLVFIKS